MFYANLYEGKVEEVTPEQMLKKGQDHWKHLFWHEQEAWKCVHKWHCEHLEKLTVQLEKHVKALEEMHKKANAPADS